MKSAGRRFEFGDFLLIPGEHLLLRAGEPIRLARKDFDLLVRLVERQGGLVRKEELLQLLWPDAFVEEGNLTKHVSTLRKTLGDGSNVDRFIETVPRVGFRFVASVRCLEDRSEISGDGDSGGTPAETPLPTQSRRRAMGIWIGVVMTIAVITTLSLLFRRHPEPSAGRWRALAVLPFDTLGAPQDVPDWLGLGLADGIITRLSGQRLLPVRSTSAVRAFGGRTRPPIGEIGRALDAEVVLEGHIQRANETVRVTVQLTDVKEGAPIWADTFDQPSSRVFALEDAIAERVAGALRLQLASAEQQRLRRRYTSNNAAYEAYVAGRDALLQYTPQGAELAVRHFERALALDPAYVLARAGLAMASADMYLRYAQEAEVQQWGERAEREAAEALLIDPDIAEAHVARAAVLRKREFNWEETIVESERAITLNPNLDQPYLFKAAAFYHLGLMDQSNTALEHARSIHGPDVVEPLRIEALISFFGGEFGLARQRLEAVSRRSSRAIGNAYLALAYFYTGDVGRSRAMLEELIADKSASTAARSGAALAGVLAASGEAGAARAVIARVLNQSYRDHHVAYGLGAAYAQLRDSAEAMRWLRSAADTGFPCATFYAKDPLLTPLRGNTDFRAFLAELTRKHDEEAARYARQ